MSTCRTTARSKFSPASGRTALSPRVGILDAVDDRKTFETSATVEDQGRVQVAGVPFAAGTRVEVVISPVENGAAAADQRRRPAPPGSSRPSKRPVTSNPSAHCGATTSMPAKATMA
jgi:hypothetical protein